LAAELLVLVVVAVPMVQIHHLVLLLQPWVAEVALAVAQLQLKQEALVVVVILVLQQAVLVLQVKGLLVVLVLPMVALLDTQMLVAAVQTLLADQPLGLLLEMVVLELCLP
jgi:hypothetical protein